VDVVLARSRVPTLLESPGFLGTISRSWNVLENGFGPGKSWNFLGFDTDVGGGQNDAGADAEICVFAHLCRLFR